MTDERSLERAARSWLEEGPTQAPDHAVDAALLLIQTTRQERDLWIPWRVRSMSPTARVAAATALGAVVVVGALLISRTSSNVGQAPAGPSQPTVLQPSTTPGAVAPSPSAINVFAGYTQLPGWIVFEHFGFAIDGSSTTFNNDFRQVWLVHADGSNLHELAPGAPASGKASPDISPDGKKVAFASWEPFSQLYEAPIDGGTPIKVTTGCGAANACAENDPSYSPDGKSIAFVRQAGSPAGTTVIGVRNLATGKVALIESTRVPVGQGDVAQPSWSPDGTQLAYHRNTRANMEDRPTRIRIEVVNVDGSGLHELPAPSGSDKAGDPDWSPDGSLIVFSTMPNREGEGDGAGVPGIYTIHPDGTGLTRICGPCIQGGIAPSWTPDGKHILFWGNRTWALMDPDGKNMAHINAPKLTWFGKGLGYSYFALLQPTP